ncbi:hypothetical protein DAPPUDRAFT_251943 [Daphnia pulex]|uniref:Uncharacterized protein n=1 Tax=Daphnia pulex TaxID=6669 RepID=E9H1A1_DAPPU|nr:hypothetical protein DAPPUDRAFT_251943 [Daphnia pulex]|eukprot:EFX74407.1 hypothetical protein DAPPUDRAFT_251943 [Daphnia pulex]
MVLKKPTVWKSVVEGAFACWTDNHENPFNGWVNHKMYNAPEEEEEEEAAAGCRERGI